MRDNGATAMMVVAGPLLMGAGLYIMIGLPVAIGGAFLTWLALKD